MTKLLNLDDIQLDSQRKVRYKGVDYAVVDFDVESFIKFQGHFRAFGKAYNSDEIQDMRKVILEAKEIVAMGVPGFPVDDVGKLNPLQIMSLVSMVAGMLPDADEETKETMEKKDQQEGQAE